MREYCHCIWLTFQYRSCKFICTISCNRNVIATIVQAQRSGRGDLHRHAAEAAAGRAATEDDESTNEEDDEADDESGEEDEGDAEAPEADEVGEEDKQS